MILCCKCGISIQPNIKNMCGRCMNSETDLSRQIKTSMTVENCRGCDRYLLPPDTWKTLAWGSKDLLIFLLSRNKSLKKFNIVDTGFIYTEEHSKKMKVEVVISQDGVEQSCILRYNIINLQCKECMRVEAKQYWNCLVQLRQRPHHRRTFLLIEQLMLKHKAHLTTTNIKERKDGIDFYYSNRNDALRMVEFINGFWGARVLNSSRIISEDVHNNTANKKFTFSVEIPPFCADDLVHIEDDYLGIGQFAVVVKTRSVTTFMNPLTLKTAKLHSKDYFANESQFKILMRSTDFKKYKVIYCKKTKDGLMDATISNDDITFHDIVTHLPIKNDDLILGYDVGSSNLNTEFPEGLAIIPMRKFDNLNRNWKVKTEKEVDDEYLYFIDDISKEKDILKNICIFDEKDELVTNVESMGL